MRNKLSEAEFKGLLAYLDGRGIVVEDEEEAVKAAIEYNLVKPDSATERSTNE